MDSYRDDMPACKETLHTSGIDDLCCQRLAQPEWIQYQYCFETQAVLRARIGPRRSIRQKSVLLAAVKRRTALLPSAENRLGRGFLASHKESLENRQRPEA